MKTKKKTILASLIPGFGHFYIGLRARGGIFLLAQIIFYILIRSVHYNSENSVSILSFQSFSVSSIIQPFCWILYVCSIMDAIVCFENIFTGKIDINDEEAEEKRDRKLIGMILNIIPGVGHLFLGKVNKGKSLLLLFFLIYVIANVVNLQILTIALMLLIVLSVLDLYRAEESEVNNNLFEIKDFYEKCKKVCVVAGVLLILYAIVYAASEVLAYFGNVEMVNYIKYFFNIAINALIAIFIGFILIKNGIRYSEAKEKELDQQISEEKEKEKIDEDF
ncbi:hypothetical protein [Inconstantimicrobium mannanitabidum]|uniref:Uncharacterized protein n=1 Tax=Inconstantimicrobium mannanitabidum TaxID=1604901 RepID=A0ACB5RCP7_9CLOT|nr:hypothetical protein [Clostridium sp. TW13]GKX66861.1 hypothetical protein rsdtw13_21190 [Clostridium sp. TW13]